MPTQEVTFSVPSASWKDKKRIKLLDNVSGTFQPRTVSAIMGPTGSGKTTLLGRYPSCCARAQEEALSPSAGRPQEFPRDFAQAYNIAPGHGQCSDEALLVVEVLPILI